MGRRDRWRATLVIGLLLACGQRAAALNNPNQFCTGNPCMITGAKTADAGAVLDFGTRDVILKNTLTMQQLANGGVGSLTINAGSFTITGGGQIKGFSSSAGGGQLTITAINTININSTIGSGAVRLSGQDGGELNLTTTTGSVSIAGRTTLFGDGVMASGGSLTIDSGANLTITGEFDNYGGLQGLGGDMDLTAVGDMTVTGFVDLTGGDVGGGFVDISAGGSLILGEMDMSGSGEGGDAGFVSVDAGNNVRFQGEFRGRGADNGEDCGDGADIDVTAGGDIFVATDMDIRGRGTDCSGGTLSLQGNSVFVQADLGMSATGPQGDGGDLELTAHTLIRLTANVALDGGYGGGGVIMTSDKDVEILGNINASGRSAVSPGASIAEFDAGKVTISGAIDASAGTASAPGAAVIIAACDVITNPSAVIEALGSGGSISATAHDTLKLRGQLRASNNGGIGLRYGPAANPPDTAGAVFSPPPSATLDSMLAPCRVCDTNADCADGNPCTDDICNTTVCLNPPLNGGMCEDGDPCTMGDVCFDGICQSGPAGTCNDADQDGKSDDADECTTLAWTEPPTKPPNQNPLKFGFMLNRLADGSRKMLLKGLFNPAPSQPIVINPAVNGLHIYAEDLAGPFYDVSLPGGQGCTPGDGWKRIGAGFRITWRYRNQSGAVPPDCLPGSAGGITSMQIKAKRLDVKGALQFKIKANNPTLLHDPTQPLSRLQISLALAAQSAPGVASKQAKAGQCAEALFTGNPISSSSKPYCRAKPASGTVDSLTCKGL